MADEVWLNDGIIIKNCKIIDVGEKQVKINVRKKIYNYIPEFEYYFKSSTKIYKRNSITKIIYKKIESAKPTEFISERKEREQRLKEKQHYITKINYDNLSIAIISGIVAWNEGNTIDAINSMPKLLRTDKMLRKRNYAYMKLSISSAVCIFNFFKIRESQLSIKSNKNMIEFSYNF